MRHVSHLLGQLVEPAANMVFREKNDRQNPKFQYKFEIF